MKPLALMAAALIALAPSAVPAQGAGAQVSRIIVPFAPGGARELLARTFYQELGKELGQTLIIESKPGAGGAIGTTFVGRAEPDGRTLLMAASSHFVTAEMGTQPRYDPIKGFTPVANIGNQSYVLMISAALPAANVAEFVKLLRSQPGAMNYGSAGVGSSTHLAMAYFLAASGSDMMHVPYKSTQEAANDVAAGRLQAVIVPNAGVGAYVQDKRLRLIGVTASEPSPLLPGVPPIARAGVPSYVFESWFGLLAPAGTPAAEVARINAAVARVLALPAVKTRLETQGVEAAALSPEAFAKLFADDQQLMARIVRDAKLGPR